jgi:hypothetical protein
VVPRQHSSGGKTVLLGLTKRANRYLRTLLIHGGRSALGQYNGDARSGWARRISAERQFRGRFDEQRVTSVFLEAGKPSVTVGIGESKTELPGNSHRHHMRPTHDSGFLQHPATERARGSTGSIPESKGRKLCASYSD